MAERPRLRPDDQRAGPATCITIRPRMEVALIAPREDSRARENAVWFLRVDRANDIGKAFGFPWQQSSRGTAARGHIDHVGR